jgi:decaprenyl-phosphate phosphoribosyltransferase
MPTAEATAITDVVDAIEVSHGPPAFGTVVAGAGARRAPSWSVVVRACRPRQWVKNALVVIAPAAAGVLTQKQVALAVVGAFGTFCLLSSATYLINDVRDLESDRRHRRKWLRPIAAGELSPRRALRIAALLAALGLGLALAIRPMLALVGVAYLLLTSSYSLLWRQIAIADIVAIALGFVLRSVAGAVAAGVPVSRSFLIVTLACALFVVAGKRYAELDDRRQAAAARATLGAYSRRMLRLILAGTALFACLAYARWAFARPEVGPWFELSMVPFVLWLGRYRGILNAGRGEAPEELILGDPGLIALGAAWVLLFIGGVYGAPW